MTTRNRRHHGDGSLRRRGENTWEIKVHAVDPVTGQRVRRFYSFKGTHPAAKQRLRELAQAAHSQELPDEQVRFGAVLDAWEKKLSSPIAVFPFKKVPSPKTAERYRELVQQHIRPHLGELKFKQLTHDRIEAFYADLKNGVAADRSGRAPLSTRTIGHIHTRLYSVFKLAERSFGLKSNPTRLVTKPKCEAEEDEAEIQIFSEDEIRDVLAKLEVHKRMRRMALIGISTGVRRGELLALRWNCIDLESGTMRVEQSLEETRTPGRVPKLGDGLRFKAPKNKYSRRTIGLAPSVVTQLRAFRAEQAKEWIGLGLPARELNDALLFRHVEDGSPLVPNSVSTEWKRLVGLLKLPKVTLHAWRHTHASQLIAGGIDVVAVSRRLGHANPTITLKVYAHAFRKREEQNSRQSDPASAVVDSTFSVSG